MNTAQRIQSRAKHQASPTSWAEAIAGNREQDPENATKIMNRVRAAFEALKSGGTDSTQYDRVASAFNVGLIRAEQIDFRAVEVMQAGSQALERCDGIWLRHHRYGFTGPDLVLAADALDLYEQILRKSTPYQMVAALEEAARRMLQQAQANVN